MHFLNRIRGLQVLHALLLAVVMAALLPLTATPAAQAAGCDRVPVRPRLVLPVHASSRAGSRRVSLEWQASKCAVKYNIQVRVGVQFGRPMDAANNLTDTKYLTRRLDKGNTYWWLVEACNSKGCTRSDWNSFELKP